VLHVPYKTLSYALRRRIADRTILRSTTDESCQITYFRPSTAAKVCHVGKAPVPEPDIHGRMVAEAPKKALKLIDGGVASNDSAFQVPF
jgi:hypothetical protein